MIIVNPSARNLPAEGKLDEAERWLQEQGWKVERRKTSRAGQAMELAADAAARGMPLVFVCGGDGTINEAVNGLAGSETALAVIPAGTVSLWAREMRIPHEPLAAVQAQLDGQRLLVDLGRAGDRYFMLVAGYGFDGAVAQRVRLGWKRWLGAASYVLAALWTAVRYRGSRVRLQFDGGETVRAQALMLVIGNTRNYAGIVELTPEANVNDGVLDVCLFQGKGTADILLHGLRILFRRHTKSSSVLYRKARHLTLDWEKPLPLQLDGDAFVGSPRRIDVVPGALWVAVPPSPVRSPLFVDPARTPAKAR